jgi:hypothetical protein
MSEFEKYMEIMEKIITNVDEDGLPDAVKKIWNAQKGRTQQLINNAKKDTKPYILSPLGVLINGAAKLSIAYPGALSEKAIQLMNKEIDASIQDKTLKLTKNVKRLRHED